MPLWDKVRQELDRAGRGAQEALDEGRTRLDAFRARQQADRAAQALGYAVYRAGQGGSPLPAAELDRLTATLTAHDREATRLEQELQAAAPASAAAEDAATRGAPPPTAPAGPMTAASAEPSPADAGGGQASGSSGWGVDSARSGSATPPHGDVLDPYVPRHPDSDEPSGR